MNCEGYTKGEWVEDGDDIGVIKTYSDEEIFIPVCSIHTPHLYNTPTAILEEAANKKLILGAPDLLAACKNVVQWHREHDSGEGELFGPDFVTSCIAAIARAEGRN